MFLIVARYTDKQMGPVMGLLGTIVGYLLGNNSSQSPEGLYSTYGKANANMLVSLNWARLSWP